MVQHNFIQVRCFVFEPSDQGEAEFFLMTDHHVLGIFTKAHEVCFSISKACAFGSMVNRHTLWNTADTCFEVFSKSAFALVSGQVTPEFCARTLVNPRVEAFMRECPQSGLFVFEGGCDLFRRILEGTEMI